MKPYLLKERERTFWPITNKWEEDSEQENFTSSLTIFTVGIQYHKCLKLSEINPTSKIQSMKSRKTWYNKNLSFHFQEEQEKKEILTQIFGEKIWNCNGSVPKTPRKQDWRKKFLNVCHLREISWFYD